jgi:peptide/nickel transport system substrate-binding protein
MRLRGGRPAGYLVLFLACSAAVAAFGALACSAPDSNRSASDRPLVLGYAAELQTLNPVVSTDQNANELIYYLLYTPLVVYDSTFRVRPWLAERWELTDSTVVFELRDDVTWHDGEPLTAEDVKFTFDLAKDPQVASPLNAAYLANVDRAEVLTPHRVRFHFGSVHAQPLEDFFWPPVPRHLLDTVPPAEIGRHGFGRAPVGSGPYRFLRWEVNQQLAFEARDDFPASLGGTPPIRRVVYRIVPERTTLLAELLRGDVHLNGPLSPADARRVEADSETRLLHFPWRQFTYLGWNTQREPFTEPVVRRALAMALDRDELLAAVLRGYGQVASSVIPPWHPYAPRLDPLPHAPDSAAALLVGAGWVDLDGDGVRERAGHPLEFVLLASQRNPVFGELVQIIQAQLARVGVRVEPRLLEWQTVLGLHRARDFDAVLTNWVLDNFRIDPRPLFHSRQVEIEGSANRSSYANPVADSLMDLGVRTLDDAPAATVWQALAETLQRDQPLTLLFWNDELAGVRRELQGVRMDARGELVTLPRWRWRDETRGGSVTGRAEAGEAEEEGDGDDGEGT